MIVGVEEWGSPYQLTFTAGCYQGKLCIRPFAPAAGLPPCGLVFIPEERYMVGGTA